MSSTDERTGCPELPLSHSCFTRSAPGCISRARRATPAVAPRAKGHWSARRDEVAALRNAGLSYAGIARQLGVTRSSVAGAVHRHLQKEPRP
jgi:DNA-binding NarL/FixJ family response regulator